MDRNNREGSQFGNVVDGEEELSELDDRLATRCKRRSIDDKSIREAYDFEIGGTDCERETKETYGGCPIRVVHDDERIEGGGRLEEAAADDDEDEVDADYKKTLEEISLGLWAGAHLSVFDGHVDGSEKGNARAGGDTDGGGVEEDGHADNRFMHGCNTGAKSADDNNADRGDDMVDPDYKMWLDALREDGIFYSIEVPWTNQISEVIRYHTEDGLFDGPNVEVENMETMDGSPTRKNNKPEKVSSGPSREMKAESVSKGKRVETEINLRRGRMRTESKFKDVHSKKRESSLGQWKAKRGNLDPASGNARAGGCTDGGGIEEDGHADNRFMHGCNTGANSVDDNHADKGDDMVDPDYKMWLDALREDGISYSVEVPWTNQISEVIRYHTEDGVFDRTNVENMETMDGSPRRKNNKPEKISSGPSREMKTESVHSKFKDVHSKKGESSVGQWKAKRGNLDPASGKACGQTGKRLRTEIPGSTNRQGKQGEEWDGADKGYKIFLSSLEKDGNPFSFKPETNKRPRDQSPGSTDFEGKHGAKWNKVDKSYEIFLKSLKKDGNSLVFIHEGGKKVIYEKSSSESEVYILEADPFVNSNRTPFVASKVQVLLDEDDEDNFGDQHSQFREKLAEILKKPYNGKEFEDLYHKASHRSPKQRDREMRNGREVRYQTGLLGKSYLDQHKGIQGWWRRRKYSRTMENVRGAKRWKEMEKGEEKGCLDLAKMIASAKSNRPKALNLLRGLFYWLQNVAQEGSFVPWRQPWCSNVLPNSN